MGFFIELILDIFFEGSMELATNGKLPKWIRIIAGIILFLVFIGIVGLFLYLAYESLQERELGASILCFILASICAIFFLRDLYASIVKKVRRIRGNKK